jgi:undecaprenyl-diphosphatase
MPGAAEERKILNIIKSIIYGIVEGITEWLPISSTGHMILLKEIMPLKVSEAYWDMYLEVIQLGAILAVVVLFWDRIWPFGRKNNRHPVRETGILSWFRKDVWEMWFKMLVACLPAVALVALHLDDKCNELFYNAPCVAGALIVFGVAFIIVETLHAGKQPRVRGMHSITYPTALVIGIFQLIAAIFPGTSRSGATIIGALIMGVSRTTAAEFTFIMGVPVMMGASLKSLVKYGHMSGAEGAVLAAGMLTAFAVSVAVIKFLMGYIKKHDFKIFGWYRIALGFIVLLFFFMK